MPGTSQRTKRRGRGMNAATLLLALAASGCSSSGFFGTQSTPQSNAAPASSSGISNFFSSSSARAPQTAAGAQPDVNCPPVEIRRGASTLPIGTTGDKSAMTLKYQGEFTREARECSVTGGAMTMRVGVQGRVVVGPAGGPGQVDVPLRIAVVQETPGGTRPIVTKFVVVPVVIGANDGSGLFSHVEEAISFPLPTPTSQLDDYIVYVGFDPQAAETQAKPPPKARPRPKPKPAASAN